MNVLFYSYSDSSDKELLVRINTIGYSKENLKTHTPRAGSGVVRMDPLHFLAGCRTRRLNQV